MQPTSLAVTPTAPGADAPDAPAAPALTLAADTRSVSRPVRSSRAIVLRGVIFARKGLGVRLLLAVLVISLCSLTLAGAQEVRQDVVYLLNGSVIRGSILELAPDGEVRIQTSDGSIFVYRMDEVERIAKETPLAPLSEPRTAASNRKSAGVAFGLSFLLPGLGQYYNGQPGKAILQEALYVGGLALALGLGTETVRTNWMPPEYGTQTNDWYTVGVGVALASWCWSMVDAPLQAGRLNAQTDLSFGHLLELRGDRYVVGLDPVLVGGARGVEVVLHF